MRKIRLLLPFLLAVPAWCAMVANIACGSATDTGYSGGYAWSSANQISKGFAPLPSQVPYNALRASNGAEPVTYTLPIPAGTATVVLQFLEPNKTGAEQRVFSVAINGAVVIPRLDLFAAAGLLTPYSQTFTVTSTGTVAVVLTGIVGNAVISGISGATPDAPSAASTSLMQCEDGVSTGGGAGDLGGLYPDTYVLTSCENMGSTSRQVVKIRCRADIAGFTADLQAQAADGTTRQLLSSPAACGPGGIDTSAAGTALAPGEALRFLVTVPVPVPGSALPKRCMVTVTMEQDSGSTVQTMPGNQVW